MRRDEHSFCTFATIRLAQYDHMLLNADLALAVPLPQTDSMYTRQSSTVVVLVAQPGRRRLNACSCNMSGRRVSRQVSGGSQASHDVSGTLRKLSDEYYGRHGCVCFQGRTWNFHLPCLQSQNRWKGRPMTLHVVLPLLPNLPWFACRSRSCSVN